MTKAELLGAMYNSLNNFILGKLLADGAHGFPWNTLSGKTLELVGPTKSLQVPLGPLVENLTNPKGQKILKEELHKSIKRSLMRDGHELIDWYCSHSKQYSKYQALPWWNFARLIRNTVSHKLSGDLTKWPKDLVDRKILQVSWRDRTLDYAMVGKQIIFSDQEALQLFWDQMEFAKTDLD